MPEDDLAKLRETAKVMADEAHDHWQFLQANKSFHSIVAWATDNTLFGYLTGCLLDLDRVITGIDYPKARREAIVRAHNTIIEALERHDEDLAETAKCASISISTESSSIPRIPSFANASSAGNTLASEVAPICADAQPIAREGPAWPTTCLSSSATPRCGSPSTDPIDATPTMPQWHKPLPPRSKRPMLLVR